MGIGILYAVLAMTAFTAVNLFCLMPLFSLMPGDEFTMSFHLFTYGGIVLLCGAVVFCTYLILKKLDMMDKKQKRDMETKE